MRGVRLVLIAIVAATLLVPAPAALAAGESTTESPVPPAQPLPPASSTEGPALSLVAAPATVRAGTAALVIARLGIGGVELQLSRRAAGEADFTFLRTLVTDPGGTASWTPVLSRTTTYRVEFAGDAQSPPATAEATVSVRPRMMLTATGLVYKGERVTFRVHVGPPHPGAAVTLETWDGDAWVSLRTLALDAESRTRFARRAGRSGRLAFRVRMAADAEHVAGASAVQRVTVRPPNPYHVPLSLARIVVVDKSQYRLYFFAHGREVRSFPCVLGRPSLPTPTGHFHIYARGMNPGGPYGARIMSYHSPFAIHGTNEPGLLKRFPRDFSHGCTRLLNANAIWLYEHAPMGTPVWNVP